MFSRRKILCEFNYDQTPLPDASRWHILVFVVSKFVVWNEKYLTQPGRVVTPKFLDPVPPLGWPSREYRDFRDNGTAAVWGIS